MTVIDPNSPGKALEQSPGDRRIKVQAALHGAAVHAGVVGRYLRAELRATTVATASQTWRLARYVIASVRLAVSTRSLRRAQLDLGEKSYQVGTGNLAIRDAVRELDDQIKNALEAKRSASKFVAERRERLIRLAESSASTSNALPAGPERERVLACQREQEEQCGRRAATRIRLWPSSATETKRVGAGVGMCLMLLVAVMLASSHKPGSDSRANDTTAELPADGKEHPANRDANRNTAAQPTSVDPTEQYAEAHFDRGLAHADKGDCDKAIADYTEAIRLDPKYAKAFNNRGAAYRKKGELAKSMADITKAIQLDPKLAEAYSNRGVSWGEKGDLDKAITDFTEAIRLDPKLAIAFRHRGVAYAQKNDIERSIADLAEAIRLDPKNADAYYSRAISYQEKGDLDKAIADFSEAIRLNPKDVAAFNNRGATYSDKGEPDRAITDFTEAIRLDPKHVKAYSNRAFAYGKKGELDKAIVDLSEAIRLDPKDAKAFRHRGLLRRRIGDLDNAEEDFARAKMLGY